MKKRKLLFLPFPSYLEVVITLGVVLILISVLIPQAKGFLEKVRALRVAKEIKILEIAINSFYELEGRFPKDVDELFKKGYLLFKPEGYEIVDEGDGVKIVLRKNVNSIYLKPIISGIRKKNGNVFLQTFSS